MHPEHPHGQRLRGVYRADSHQSGDNRNPERRGELGQRACGIRVDDAAARVDQGPPGLREHLEEAGRLVRIEQAVGQLVHTPAVAGNGQHAAALKHPLPVLHVLRHIDDDGTGASGARDLECGADGRLQLRRVGHQEYVLGHGSHDRGYGGFLERIGADRRCGHLAADHDDGDGVRHAITHGRHCVRRTRSGSDQADAHTPCGAGVAGGHESRSLLIGGDDQGNRLLAGSLLLLVEQEYGVVGRQDGAAAVAENGGHAFVGEHLHDHPGTRHPLSGKRVSRGAGLDHRVAHERDALVGANRPMTPPRLAAWVRGASRPDRATGKGTRTRQ